MSVRAQAVIAELEDQVRVLGARAAAHAATVAELQAQAAADRDRIAALQADSEAKGRAIAALEARLELAVAEAALGAA